MKIEYVTVFDDYDTAIFSKRFSGFCSNLRQDQVLLAGFLPALTSIPVFSILLIYLLSYAISSFNYTQAGY